MHTLFLLLQLAGGSDREVFTSQEGSFLVDFPRAPIQNTVTVPTPEGLQVRHVFHYSDNQVVYFLWHSCMPPPTLPSDPEKVLDLARDGGLEMTGNTLVSEKRIIVDGHPGRHLIEKGPDGNLGYFRIVVGDNGTFYSLSASPRSKAATKKALAFLDSFRILPTTERSFCRRDAIREP